ncbi:MULTISPECIES: Fe(3+) ABC transporter substrate-binding protein [unclassified Arsukibacterium]|uniref:Fe(3+) ABC transporter substrate-binding protein n=1 Tax=unclassified Arsukibacterium TaxID=2635278 RepID=UPI000C3EF5C4|nr:MULTISPECIES: Fe(3+) ABC transporter substrate-binding protein [unclassified Arsukibacterium]MBM34195.1 Fe(3+) ABC transporter substrate-binding protein [Rheinheimera sp.]HAW92196.1 Fe(3+) ABC transporter substrate-binding protein [Candidatus Azambacteria bacterium]
MRSKPTFLIVSALASALFSAASAIASEVNIYSARQEELIKPLLDDFTKDTGIKVNLITGKPDELISRLASEGRNSPADVLISTDVGRLYRAKTQGVLQSIESDTLNTAIPEELRDPAGQWYGLTMRARPIMYVPGKVNPEELSTYADLASPKWRGRICIRSSDNIYNQSMVAGLIAHEGAAAAEQWVEGLVANFARPPRGGDRDQISAAASGVCDIAIANTYYLGGMLADSEQRATAEKVKVFWPDQAGTGAHVNISGAGVAAHAPNKANAVRLLEYMVTEQAQQWYAQQNHEYPVVKGVQASELLQSFGQFNADELNLDKLGELNAEAIRVMDRAGWR